MPINDPRGPMPPFNPFRKTLVIPVMVDLFLQTDGSMSYTYVELDVPEVEDIGPEVEQVYFLTINRNRTTNQVWTIGWSGTNSGRNWNVPTPLFTDISANGESQTGVHSTAATFAWRKSKLVAATKNASGAARESSLASAWLVLDRRS